MAVVEERERGGAGGAHGWRDGDGGGGSVQWDGGGLPFRAAMMEGREQQEQRLVSFRNTAAAAGC